LIPLPSSTAAISAPIITYNANRSVTVTATAGTVNVSLSVVGGAAVSKSLSSGSATFTNTDVAGLTSPSAGDHSLSSSNAAQGYFAASGPTLGTLHVNPASTTTVQQNLGRGDLQVH
jgi:hypothetical protein